MILLYLWIIRINGVVNYDIRITLPAKWTYLKNEIGTPSNDNGDSIETDRSCSSLDRPELENLALGLPPQQSNKC